MMVLILGGLLASTGVGRDDALQICRPVLARKAGGDIQSIAATMTRKTSGGFTITGQLTIFVGMEKPQPGSASAHHLIRESFAFSCRTVGGNVRKATVSPIP